MTDSKQKVISLVRKPHPTPAPAFVMPFMEDDSGIFSDNDDDDKAAAAAAAPSTTSIPIQDIKDWKVLDKSEHHIEWEKLNEQQHKSNSGSRLWIARPVKTKELVKDPVTGKVTAVAVPEETEEYQVGWICGETTTDKNNHLQSPRPVVN